MESIVIDKNRKGDDLFPLVNDKDEVMGSAFRSYVHANNLLHRAVHALVFNRDGKLLMQMRSALKDRYPSCYTTSCSGHVDYGETYETALIREFYEELGVKTKLEDFVYIGKVEANSETEGEFTKVYVFIEKEELEFSFPEEEVSSLDYFNREELEENIAKNPENFTKSFRFIYSYFLENCKNDKNLRIMLAKFLKK
ncbi:MAG: NUDIX domain-containing protein [Opitutales bacterium]